MLLMLRMSIPVAAFGSIILIYMLFRTKLPKYQVHLRRFHIEKLLILVALFSMPFSYPPTSSSRTTPIGRSKRLTTRWNITQAAPSVR